MPEVNGLEVTQRLRRQDMSKNTVIIATSALQLPEEQIACIEAGCNAFLPKPVRFSELLSILKAYLNLEWITCEPVPTQDEVTNDSVSPSIVPPSTENLNQLYDLAIQGDIRGILEQASILEQLGAQFTPFVQSVRQLAENLQVNQLQNFLHQFLCNG